MTPFHVRVYRHPNPEIRSFLTDESLCPPTLWVGKRPFKPQDTKRLEALDLVAGQMVKALTTIPGIREIRLKPKEVRIRKENGFSWEEIEPRILQDIRGALRRRKLHVVARAPGLPAGQP